MAKVMNSDSIARLIARELRAGNRLKECDSCGGPRRSQNGRVFCPSCEPQEPAQ